MNFYRRCRWQMHETVEHGPRLAVTVLRERLNIMVFAPPRHSKGGAPGDRLLITGSAGRPGRVARRYSRPIPHAPPTRIPSTAETPLLPWRRERTGR